MVTADDRIDDLEWRLREYHEWLADSIAQRDQLALDAAWGVHGALNSTVALLALVYLFDRFVGWDTWYATLGLGVVVFAAQMASHMWSNDARMKEVARLAKLPFWE